MGSLLNFVTSSIFLTFILLTPATNGTRDCPRTCSCAGGVTSDIYNVDCSGQGFQELPSKSISTMTSSLSMNSNHLRSITGDSLKSLRWLISLNMSHNEISFIEDDSFRYMTRLDVLDISHNKLSTIRLGVFNGLQSLKELNLAHNELTEVGGALSDLVNLTKLDLNDNRLTAITEFTLRDLRSLRYLHLSENLIQSVDRKAFRNLQKLLYLVLRNNPLNIRRFHFQSVVLSYVDLSECQLSQVPGGLSDSIRYLQLRRNNISRLTAESFTDCPYVNILVLDENQLTSIEDSTFEKMYHLQQLWLNDNRLESLPRYLPSSLRRLLADGNRIKRVLNVFQPRSQMNMISLVGNDIRQVEKDAFSNLANLHNLDLSDNYITHIYSGTFMHNTQLRSLRYSKNPLKHFTPGCFTGLSELQGLSLGYLRGGLAREGGSGGEGEGNVEQLDMHSDLFQPMQRLQRLEMDNSPSLISAVLSSEHLLAGLTSLIELNIQGSDLTTLTPHFIHSLPSLAALQIGSSRWHCDQSLMWFRDFLRSTRVKIEEKEEIKCFTPRSLHARPIMSLRDEEFALTSTLPPPIVSKPIPNRIPQEGTDLPPRKPNNADGWMEYEVMEPDRISGRDPNRRPPEHKNQGNKQSELPDQKKNEDGGSRSIYLIAYNGPETTTQTPGVWHVGRVEAADKGREINRGEEGGSGGAVEMRIMVVVVTVVATCVVAAIIVALIIYVWNRQQQQIVDDAGLAAATIAAKQQLQHKENHERTVISYKNRSGVLYFSSSSSGGSRGKSSAAAAELRCEDTRGGGDSSSSSQSLLPSHNTSPTLVTSSHSLPEVHLINKPAKYYKTRVYKWEDF